MMKFIEDKEIDLNVDGDEFGTSKYAESLVDIIKSSPVSSFCIGLFGEWGSGKSSIIKSADNMMNANKNKNLFFTYDAWKYSKDSFRRTFLLNLAKRLDLEHEERFDSFYKSTAKPVKVEKSINFQFVGAFIFLSLLLGYSAYQLGQETDASFTIQFLATLGLIAVGFSSNFMKEYVVTRQEVALFSPEQFEECFDEILSIVMNKSNISKKLNNWFSGLSGKRDLDKLVVVIDNIDRCDSKAAYELLSAVKSFLGRDNVVFIIPVDDNALRVHITNVLNSEKKEADEFLRKLFNNTVKIKPYNISDLYGFTESLSTSFGLSFNKDTIDVIAKEYASNPRRIIQFINSLVSEKCVLSKRESESFVKENETLVAIVQIIREECPDLYCELSRSPYKLKNIDLILKDKRYESVEISSFLRKIIPHTQGISDDICKVLFSNKEQHPYVTQDVVYAIEAKKNNEIIEFVDNVDNGQEYLIEYYIAELETAGSRAVVGSISSAFNGLVYLNSIHEFKVHANKKIQGVILNHQILHRCVINFESPNSLALYASSLNTQELPYVFDEIISQMEDMFKIKDDEDGKKIEIQPKWRELIKALSKSIKDPKCIVKIKKYFYMVFRDDEFDIHELNIPKENLSILMGENLSDLIVENYDYEKDRHNELVYLIKNKTFNEDSINKWFSKYSSENGLYPGVEIDETLESLMLFVEVAKEVSLSSIKKAPIISLVENLFVNRASAPQGKPAGNTSVFLESSVVDSNVSVILEVVYYSYILTRGDEKVANCFKNISNHSEALEPIVINKIADLHNTRNYKLHYLHDYLVSLDLSEDVLNILKWLLVDKNNDGIYTLHEDNLDTSLTKCVEYLISGGDLSSYMSPWLKDERINEKITGKVSELSKEDILKLPNNVQSASYDNICKGDEIFNYEDELEFLSAMSEKKNKKYNKCIEKVVLNKLTKEESRSDGLDLLLALNNYSGMNKGTIISYLEPIGEEDELYDKSVEVREKLK